ncbi:MAG: S41 family peptidase [Pseudomonadota bacterium]
MFTQGVFEAASTFKDRCETPRSGFDIEGNAFPDLAGSLSEEKFWLRSWTNETYLWNDEVVDQNPNASGSRTNYFATLRTTELTPSGKEKDDFHFSEPTADFLERRNSTASPSYGWSLAAFSTAVPRDYRIRYTEEGSPAALEVNGVTNLLRGTRILRVDGVDLVNATSTADVNVLNDGLFPSTVGETHTFEVQDPGSNTTRTITMSAANIARRPVNATSVIDTPTGKVGYIHFTTFSPFSSEQAIFDAITDLDNQGITDLVLDLRYNGGGLLAVAGQIGYMIAGSAQTTGEMFNQLRFNADAGNRNPVTGSFDNAIPFYTTGLGFTLANGTPLPSLDLNRVFILSTGSTCSASEAVINGLRGIDVEVVLIGTTTCGKPFGFYPTDNCGETYYTIQFQGTNGKGFGDFQDGFIPGNSTASFGIRASGCVVSDDFNTQLGDPSEALLSTALSYRANGVCPSVSPKGIEPVSEKEALTAEVRVTDLSPVQSVLETNYDMTMPNGRR